MKTQVGDIIRTTVHCVDGTSWTTEYTVVEVRGSNGGWIGNDGRIYRVAENMLHRVIAKAQPKQPQKPGTIIEFWSPLDEYPIRAVRIPFGRDASNDEIVWVTSSRRMWSWTGITSFDGHDVKVVDPETA